jgi:Txe/YoeB family toxin of Txe-Axe toxin-antitoxin module
METKEDNIMPKLSENYAFKYCCKNCNYNTCKKSSYDNHILSAKHQRMTKEDKGGQNYAQNMPADCEKFVCSCGKEYQHRQGLWKHKKICNFKQTDNQMPLTTDKDLIMLLIKENSELKNMMMKVLENGTNNNTINNTTTHTNSHNKAFNLNFFLNETCKEAMNIGEFVDSLKLQLSDLEHVGEAGYIEGISNIIVKNLKELDVTKRPVHCTDKKRETIYIKDNDKWEKDEDRSKMHKLIKKVAFKNTKLFAKFKELHPDCMTYHSKHNDQYQKIVYESMGGKGDDDFEKNEKIIKNVLKEVVVDKH